MGAIILGGGGGGGGKTYLGPPTQISGGHAPVQDAQYLV